MEAEFVEEIERRCEVLVGFVDKDKASTNAKKGKLQQPYQANAQMLRDHDHMLQVSTACSGLVTFRPKILVTALGPSETRFHTLPEDLPEDVRSTLFSRLFRSSIYDSKTGGTHLECGWQVHRQSEWGVLDQGSVGWPAKLVKIYHWHLRGAECADPIHRRIRSFNNSCTEAGLHFVKAEYEMVFSFFHAPFGSNGNYNQTCKAFAQMHAAFDHKFFLFQTLYPWIVFSANAGEMPPGFGTPEHHKTVWESLPQAKFLKNIGTMCARNRWLE